MPRDRLIQYRLGTAAQWTTANPVLEVGEPGFETDTRKVKIGDGITAWTSLAYSTGGSGITDVVQDTTPQLGGDLDLNGHNVGAASAADLAKLPGIAAGAEVNVNADWNAVSGDAQILNKPAVQAPITLTTSGTSGAATFVSNTLNIPQYSAGGGGDASTNTATSVDGEAVLFSGTAGKTLKRATGSGVAKLTSGVLGTATAGADYVAPGGALGTPSSGTLTNCTFPTLNQNTTGSAATLTTSRNIDGQAFNGSADITVIAPGTHAATSKTTPVDADELPVSDSAATFGLKKLTWANLKATLKTYFDGLYLNQNTTGSAATLTTARTVQTNLASTSSASFDGSANVTPGVTGTLPVGNGGTGAATLTGIVKGNGTSAMTAAAAGTDYVAPGGALGTPSGGTLTNCTGLPVAGITASTSTALGVGSVELGHASDTTLTRSSAGVLAVEGNTVPVNTTSAVHTAGTIELGHASDTTISRAAAGSIAVEGVVVATIKPRVSSLSNTTSVSVNADSFDMVVDTGITGAITLNNPTGTPGEGQKLSYALTGTAARAISYGTAFEDGPATRPTTTTTTQRLDILFIWNGATSKWRCMAQGSA